MVNRSATLLATALAVGSSDAFIAPMGGAPAAARASTVTMKADANNNVAKASAAAVLAGMLFSGAVVAPPADAAVFTSEPASIQQSVGFGQPKVDPDPMNNNAASGRVNGNKYDPAQTGSFAKKFSADGKGADYGSAKGTDFGKTAGNSPEAASNTEGTAGRFQRDAEKPQNQGIVDIAAKKTSDAANVNVEDVSKGGNTLIDSLKDAAKGAVGAQTASAPTWGDVKGGASQAKNAVKDAVSSRSAADSTTFLATGPLSAQDSGKFSFGVVPKSPNPAKAVGVASEGPKQLISNVRDATKGQGAAAKAVADNGRAGSTDNGVAGSGVDISGKIGSSTAGQATLDRAGNAASTAASKAEQGVKGAASNTIISGLFDQAGTDQAKSAAKAGGSAVKAKVGSDVNALKDAKPTAEGQSIMSKDASSAASQTGQKTVDKVKSDLGAVDKARQNPPFQTSSADGASSITMAGLLDGKGVNPNADKVIAENVEQVKSGINALKDAKPSADSSSSIMGGDAAKAANNVGQATKDKVKGDVRSADNARKNAPLQSKVDGGASNTLLSGLFDRNPAADAGKAATGALKDAKPSASTSQSIMGGDAARAAGNTGRATTDKVKSDVDAVTKGVPSYGGDVKSKVKSDVATASSAASDAASKVDGGSVKSAASDAASKVNGGSIQGAASDAANAINGGGLKSAASDAVNAVKNAVN